MSNDDSNNEEAAPTAKRTHGPRIGNVIKLEYARSLAAAAMSAANVRFFEDMHVPIADRIKAVRLVNPDVRSFANAQGRDVIATAVKEINEKCGKVPEEVKRAERIWQIVVIGTWDDYVQGYLLLGYTVAPTVDTMHLPEYFRPFKGPQLGHFHPKSFDKKAHLQDGLDDHKVPVTLTRIDKGTFPWITNDPRFSPFAWWHDLKVPPLMFDELKAGHQARIVPAAPAAPVAAIEAATALPVAHLSAAEEMVRRRDAASSELKKLLSAPGSTFAFWNYDAEHEAPAQIYQPLRLPDKERMGVFPPNFALDIEKLKNQIEEHGRDPVWDTIHILRSVLIASRTTLSEYGFQAHVRRCKEQPAALRSDKIDENVREFQRDDPIMRMNAVGTYAEAYNALKTLILLAERQSPLFQRARPLIVVATLAKSIQRIQCHQKFVPSDAVVVCALSGEPFDVDEGKTTIDFELFENDAGIDRVTLFIKERCSSWPLMSDVVAAAPTKRPLPAPAKGEEPAAKKPRTRPSLSKGKVAAAASAVPPPPPTTPKVGTHRVLEALGVAIDMANPMWPRFVEETKKVSGGQMAPFIEALALRERVDLAEWTRTAGRPKLKALLEVVRFFILPKEFLGGGDDDAMDLDSDDQVAELLKLAPAPPSVYEFTTDWTSVPILVDMVEKSKTDPVLKKGVATLDPLFVYAFAALFQ